MLLADIQILFNNFQEGFLQFDLEKVVNCYHLPCTLNTPDKISVISTKEELENEVNGIFTQLSNECFTSVTLSNSSYMQLTEEITLASMDWKFFDKTNQVFLSFQLFII